MTGHSAESMDKVLMIKIMEPILVWVMGVGLTVKVVSRGVLHVVPIMSVLGDVRTHVTKKRRNLLGNPLH